MASDDPRKAWPPELIEFSVMTEIDRLGFVLKYILSKKGLPSERFAEAVRGAAYSIADFEPVLDEARLPKDLDETLRAVIQLFRQRAGQVPPQLVEHFWDRTIACLLRDLPDLPTAAEDYQARIAALAARSWVGDFARAIPRGWLPICERAVRVGDALIPPSTFQRVATVMLWERFGRLEWVIGDMSPRSTP